MINSINVNGHVWPASPIASGLPNPPASEWITSAIDKVSKFHRKPKAEKLNLTDKLCIASPKSLETFTCNGNLCCTNVQSYAEKFPLTLVETWLGGGKIEIEKFLNEILWWNERSFVTVTFAGSKPGVMTWEKKKKKCQKVLSDLSFNPVKCV